MSQRSKYAEWFKVTLPSAVREAIQRSLRGLARGPASQPRRRTRPKRRRFRPVRRRCGRTGQRPAGAAHVQAARTEAAHSGSPSRNQYFSGGPGAGQSEEPPPPGRKSIKYGRGKVRPTGFGLRPLGRAHQPPHGLISAVAVLFVEAVPAACTEGGAQRAKLFPKTSPARSMLCTYPRGISTSVGFLWILSGNT